MSDLQRPISALLNRPETSCIWFLCDRSARYQPKRFFCPESLIISTSFRGPVGPFSPSASTVTFILQISDHLPPSLFTILHTLPPSRYALSPSHPSYFSSCNAAESVSPFIPTFRGVVPSSTSLHLHRSKTKVVIRCSVMGSYVCPVVLTLPITSSLSHIHATMIRPASLP